MWNVILTAGQRRRAAAYGLPTTITSSAGSSVNVTTGDLTDTELTTYTLDVPLAGTWAVTGWDGVKIISVSSAGCKLAVARTIVSGDSGEKAVTVTFTATGVSLTYAQTVSANSGAFPVDLYPYGGQFFGAGTATINPYNTQLEGISASTNETTPRRVALPIVAPWSGLITAIQFQIASNKSGSESKSLGTGDITLAVNFRGPRSGAADRPGDNMSPERTFTHNLGTNAAGLGGDQRKLHRIELYQKRYGAITAGTSTTVTLASGSSATNGYYVGAVIKFATGTCKDAERAITAYNGTTRVATFATLAPATPAAGDEYAIGVKVTKGTRYFGVIHNTEQYPNQKFASVNCGAQFTGGTGSGQTSKDFTPLGLTPPRGCSVAWGDWAYQLSQSTGTPGTVPNENYGRSSGVINPLGIEYYVPNFGLLKWTHQEFDTGGDTSLWQKVRIGGADNRKIRVRWTHPAKPAADFVARYFWLHVRYAPNARPNATLDLVVRRTSGTAATLATASVSPCPAYSTTSPVVDTSLTLVNEWSNSNTNAALYIDDVRFDLGADGITFVPGQTYEVELSSAASSYYNAHGSRNINFGMNYTDNDAALGINNTAGRWLAWRDDPASPNRPAYMEEKIGTGAWTPLTQYNSNPQDTTLGLIGRFEKKP